MRPPWCAFDVFHGVHLICWWTPSSLSTQRGSICHAQPLTIPKSGTERSFYGTEFEVQLKNKLTQRAIARECADWMRRKAKFRSNSGVAPLQQFAAVQAGASATVPNAVYMPLHGFTAVDLGYQRGNAVSNIVNKFDEPANTGVFLSLFDQIWADPDKLKDVTSLVCGKRSANPPCADDVGVLRALYAKAASVGADAAVSPGAADLQLCGSSDARSRCLSGSSRSNTSFR